MSTLNRQVLCPKLGYSCKSGWHGVASQVSVGLTGKNKSDASITRETGALLTTSPAATFPSGLTHQRQRAVLPGTFYYVRAASKVRTTYPCPRPPSLRLTYRTLLVAGETLTGPIYSHRGRIPTSLSIAQPHNSTSRRCTCFEHAPLAHLHPHTILTHGDSPPEPSNPSVEGDGGGRWPLADVLLDSSAIVTAAAARSREKVTSSRSRAKKPAAAE